MAYKLGSFLVADCGLKRKEGVYAEYLLFVLRSFVFPDSSAPQDFSEV